MLYKPGAVVVLDCDLMPVLGVGKEIFDIQFVLFIIFMLMK